MATSKGGDDLKKARLADELRANLARRKAQSRSRRLGGADVREEGIAASEALAVSRPAAETPD